ncbi:MAG: hypothetical protein IKD69_07235, partial [Solobacterium sp.]|nr:hypothetical protein [Solobacterium sp.]
MLRQMIAGSSALLLLLQPALVSAKAAFHPGEGWNRSHTAYYINSQPAEGLVETDGGLCLFEKGTAVTGEVQINGLNYFFHPETSYAATHEWITI